MVLNYYNPVSRSGRKLTPCPPINCTQRTEYKWNNWHIENAIAEAETNNDKWSLTLLRAIKPNKKGKYVFTQSDRDTLDLILFGDTFIKIDYTK